MNQVRPKPSQLKAWINQTLKKKNTQGTVAVKIVDEAEMTALNTQYRNKAKPTNVLSFPCLLPTAIRGTILGDIILCAPIVEKEALEQNTPILAHWAHLTIHGVLHLLGHDHEIETDAILMENLETEILHELGFNDPYRVTHL